LVAKRGQAIADAFLDLGEDGMNGGIASHLVEAFGWGGATGAALLMLAMPRDPLFE
jgi:hypothetical protein